MEKYRPSTGTEGAGFIAEWCCNCERDKNEDCPIVAATFRYDVDDPLYPREWVRDEYGPKCTAFLETGKPIPTDRCKATTDMFKATA